MNPFVIYFCSGGAFFAGSILCSASFIFSFRNLKGKIEIFCRVIFLIGLLLIALSSTPLNKFLSSFFILSSCVYATIPSSGKFSAVKNTARILSMILIFLFVCIEFLNSLPPRIETAGERSVFVFGDSLSAGIGFKGERTWTQLLEEEGKYELTVFSIGGAGVSDLIPSSKKISERKGLVLVLLGGNDIFRQTEPAVFENSLDQLLANLADGKRTVVMFELPLPPFHAEYGRIQRKIARRHSVALVPKYRLASVLSGRKSTVDGLHLSNYGHEKLANTCREILGGFIRSDPNR